MSAEERNKLDELFKKGLDVPDTHFEYNDQDWDDFEQLMDADKRPRGIVYWLPILSGVAALLLVVFGWWFFKPAPVNTNNVAVVKHPTVQAPANNLANSVTTKDSTPSNNNAVNLPATTPAVKQQPAVVNTPTAPLYANVIRSPKQHVAVEQQASESPAVVNQPNTVVNIVPDQPKKEILASNVSEVPKNNNTVNAAASSTSTEVAPANSAAASQEVIAKAPAEQIAAANEKPKKVKTTISGHKGPQFGLAMLVSPDINGAGSFQNAKVGTNLGLMLSIGVTKKLTISTGAAYSKKPYMTDFSNYHVGYKFKTDPEDVYADCRVLDIPLNVDYKVYHKSSNSFSLGTGLSSYLMLKETYNYDYAVPGTVGPASFTVVNKNRHILGVLNLNATYEHQLNSKFSIAAQPYLKIPLTNIGNSQVKLQSAGVALGLRWNINQSITP